MRQLLRNPARRIITVEDRIAQLTESVKHSHGVLENHAERLARLEGKFELLENTFSAPPPQASGKVVLKPI